MHMYTNIAICIYAYVHTYIYIHMYIYIYMYVYMQYVICEHKHIYICIYLCVMILSFVLRDQGTSQAGCKTLRTSSRRANTEAFLEAHGRSRNSYVVWSPYYGFQLRFESIHVCIYIYTIYICISLSLSPSPPLSLSLCLCVCVYPRVRNSNLAQLPHVEGGWALWPHFLWFSWSLRVAPVLGPLGPC